jgi:ribosomal protein S18 acetylase RimI-like enzyme
METMQHTPITIRQAGVEDDKHLASLARETFFDSFAADNRPEDMAAYLEKSFSPSIQAAELAEPSSLFLVAETAGKPVGYVRLLEGLTPPCIPAKKPIQLARLYARKPWIGCGVGAALMTACIDEATGRRCDGIWLGVWGRNARAIRFYRRWGFEQMGTQPFVLGNDRQTDLILWLPLDVQPR